jgi:hypothetical protein
MNFLETQINNHQRELVNQTDSVIKQALEKNGIPLNDLEYLKENIQIIYIEDDPFEHYYFRYDTPDEKRILSIQRTPDIKFGEDITAVKVTASLLYY